MMTKKLLEIDLSVNHTINRHFIVRPNVVQRAGQLSLPHEAISKTERNRTTNIKPMSGSYNTLWIKHKLLVNIYSNTETSLVMSTLVIWCRVVQSRDVRSRVFSRLPVGPVLLCQFMLNKMCCGLSTNRKKTNSQIKRPHYPIWVINLQVGNQWCRHY